MLAPLNRLDLLSLEVTLFQLLLLLLQPITAIVIRMYNKFSQSKLKIKLKRLKSLQLLLLPQTLDIIEIANDYDYYD